MKKMNKFNVFKAVSVRCILALHVIICTWRVEVGLGSPIYWLLLCGLVPLICESFYTIRRRHGAEFSRFTPCFIFYLGAVLPGIWLLELDKTDQYVTGKNNLTLSSNSSDELILPILKLDPATWIMVIEEMLPYVIFGCRWVLPRGRVKREELAELLLAFIEIAADIMEFFSLLSEDVIRGNKTLVFCVLGIWSLAVLQFTMTVTVIHQPKRERKVKVVAVASSKEKEWERIKHECGAIFLTIAMQDMPFVVMRLYTIVSFNRITYSLIFFTSKNFVIIALLFYKVAVLCKKQYCPGPEDNHEEQQEDEEIISETAKTAKPETSKENGGFGSLGNVDTHIEKPASTEDHRGNRVIWDNELEFKTKNCDSDNVNPKLIENEDTFTASNDHICLELDKVECSKTADLEISDIEHSSRSSELDEEIAQQTEG